MRALVHVKALLLEEPLLGEAVALGPVARLGIPDSRSVTNVPEQRVAKRHDAPLAKVTPSAAVLAPEPSIGEVVDGSVGQLIVGLCGRVEQEAGERGEVGSGEQQTIEAIREAQGREAGLIESRLGQQVSDGAHGALAKQPVILHQDEMGARQGMERQQHSGDVPRLLSRLLQFAAWTGGNEGNGGGVLGRGRPSYEEDASSHLDWPIGKRTLCELEWRGRSRLTRSHRPVRFIHGDAYPNRGRKIRKLAEQRLQGDVEIADPRSTTRHGWHPKEQLAVDA